MLLRTGFFRHPTWWFIHAGATVCLFILLAASPARARVPGTAICRDASGLDFVCAVNTPWLKLDRHTLSVREEGGPVQAQWLLESTAERDFRIEYRLPGEEPGDIMVLSGFVMLIRGLELSPLEQIRALEGPVLMSNLGLSLLYLALPAGPEALAEGEKWALSAEDGKMPIRVSSPSSAAFFGAPWKVSGEAQSSSGKVTYEITLTFMEADQSGRVPEGAKESRIVLSGTWEKLAAPPHFPDDLSISGRQLTTLGPGTRELADGSIVDMGARLREAKPATVGEVRRLLKEAR